MAKVLVGTKLDLVSYRFIAPAVDIVIVAFLCSFVVSWPSCFCWGSAWICWTRGLPLHRDIVQGWRQCDRNVSIVCQRTDSRTRSSQIAMIPSLIVAILLYCIVNIYFRCKRASWGFVNWLILALFASAINRIRRTLSALRSYWYPLTETHCVLDLLLTEMQWNRERKRTQAFCYTFLLLSLQIK